jgi:hypothetical protein
VNMDDDWVDAVDMVDDDLIRDTAPIFDPLRMLFDNLEIELKQEFHK